MVILYKRMDEVLNFFDLDCISLGFDGRNVLALPRTLRSLQTGAQLLTHMGSSQKLGVPFDP